jgi:hypothetical protein
MSLIAGRRGDGAGYCRSYEAGRHIVFHGFYMRYN